ncbi:MAG: hypothetical protein AAGA23_06060 [Pseudomonadota bacterium]
MTSSAPKDGRDSTPNKVALVASPHHALGIALCQYLSAQGVRIVILGADPARGGAVCRRLAWQGASASFRYFSPDAGCEEGLYEDLALVYGRIDWLVSFFDPARIAPAWLSFTDVQIRNLLIPQIESRRRLLRALSPLFPPGTRHVQVCMAGDGSTAAAAALMWDRLLARHLSANQIQTRLVNVEGDVEPLDQMPRRPRSIERDLANLVDALESH